MADAPSDSFANFRNEAITARVVQQGSGNAARDIAGRDINHGNFLPF